jgi:hypothetical protein
MGSVNIAGQGSALIAAGEAVLGGTDTGAGVTAGGIGDVTVSQGGLLGTGSMTVEAGSSLGIDGASAVLVAGDLSDGGAVTTRGLLAVTGTLSGAGLLGLDGGFTSLGGLGSTNVGFGGAPALLRVQSLDGASSVSGMQVGDVIDLVGQYASLQGDTVTTNSGMLFLSPAPAGESYTLVHARDGTAVVLAASPAHEVSDIVGFAHPQDVPAISPDLLQHLTAGSGAAGAESGAVFSAIDLLMAH